MLRGAADGAFPTHSPQVCRTSLPKIGRVAGTTRPGEGDLTHDQGALVEGGKSVWRGGRPTARAHNPLLSKARYLHFSGHARAAPGMPPLRVPSG